MQMFELLLERPWFGPEAAGYKNTNRVASALYKNWLAWKGSMRVSATADEVANFIQHQYSNMASSMATDLQQLGATQPTGPQQLGATQPTGPEVDDATQNQQDKSAQINKMQTNSPVNTGDRYPPLAMGDSTANTATQNQQDKSAQINKMQTSSPVNTGDRYPPLAMGNTATPVQPVTPVQPPQATSAAPSGDTRSIMAQLPQMLKSSNLDPNQVLQTIAKASTQAKTPADMQSIRSLIQSLKANPAMMQKIPQLASLGEGRVRLSEAALLSTSQLKKFFVQMAMSMMKQQKLGDLDTSGVGPQNSAPQGSSQQAQQQQTQSKTGTSFRQLLGSQVNGQAIETALTQYRVPPAEITALQHSFRRGMTLSQWLKAVPAISGKTLNVLLGAM